MLPALSRAGREWTCQCTGHAHAISVFCSGHSADAQQCRRPPCLISCVSEMTEGAAAEASFVALVLDLPRKGIWCTALTPHPMPLPWGRQPRALLSTSTSFSVDVERVTCHEDRIGAKSGISEESDERVEPRTHPLIRRFWPCTLHHSVCAKWLHCTLHHSVRNAGLILKTVITGTVGISTCHKVQPERGNSVASADWPTFNFNSSVIRSSLMKMEAANDFRLRWF
jgi:hypothetical protein